MKRPITQNPFTHSTRIAAIALCAFLTVPAWAAEAPDAESCIMATDIQEIANGHQTAALSIRGVVAWQFRSSHTGESIQDMATGNLQFACDSLAKDYDDCQHTLERIHAAVRAERPIPFTTQLTRYTTYDGHTYVLPEGVAPQNNMTQALHPLDANIYMTTGTMTSCERAFKTVKAMEQSKHVQALPENALMMDASQGTPESFKAPSHKPTKAPSVRIPTPSFDWSKANDLNTIPALPAASLDLSKVQGISDMPAPLDLDLADMDIATQNEVVQNGGGCTIGTSASTATPFGLVLMLAVFALMTARLRKQTSL
jgi:hypothetical protein